MLRLRVADQRYQTELACSDNVLRRLLWSFRTYSNHRLHHHQIQPFRHRHQNLLLLHFRHHGLTH
ncbi:hypothetical protein HanXRQr2_Chr17g0810021 [Helianthus annuus]|uniref:Uncharacterized protein n=1 Tax=Helianthus annuus TaxID=4232 RepID=A0A9K3DK13_HELAN|nr:hypothetical protein HanXRQr2_Chr17g0810021 [Helianthus annuus]